MAADKETWILYRTENLVNGKFYIGVHRLTGSYRSKNYLGSGDNIKAAIKKYGRENFIRETLGEFVCPEDAYFAEAEMVTEEFIKRTDTYNLCLGGRGGRIQTPEIRAKLSVAHTGKTLTVETKALIKASNLGKSRAPHSIETKEKMSRSHKGKVISDEAKSKMSAAHKGKPLSEGHRARILACRCTGVKNHKSVPVVVNNIYYETALAASKYHHIHHQTVFNRIKSTTGKFANYRFATPEEKAEHSLEASRQST